MNFLLAQEVIVNVPTDWFGLGVSALAVVVAAWAAGTTYRQGRALQRMETTQHEWEQIDRKSAAIEVKGYRAKREPMTDSKGVSRMKQTRSEFVRLTNRGRAAARDVSWSASEDVIAANRESIEVLHPGEHYDLPLALTQSTAPGWEFTVTWSDDRDGTQSTQRRLSL